MITALEIKRTHWQAMSRYVAKTAPAEACGLLAGTGQRVEAVYMIPNVLHSPQRFRMAPREQLAAFQRIERQGLALLAIFHSHPKGPEFPSATDVSEWAYPVAAVIWTPVDGDWNARGFCIENSRFAELSLEIADGQ